MALELLGLDSTDDAVREGRWELDGREFILRLAWNVREGAWAIDMYTAERAPIVLGGFARTGVDVLDNITGTDRPPGRLILEDVSGAGDEIPFDGWGRTHRLVYREPRTEES